jgi:isopentenyldiphosphate isomerase
MRQSINGMPEDIRIYKDDCFAITDVGMTDKVTAHKSHLLHKSAHVLILDTEYRVLCRKRPGNDSCYAGLWTTTIGTHVLGTSDYNDTITRFLPTDLVLQWIGEFRVQDEHENEINGLFVAYVADERQVGVDFMKQRTFLPSVTLESLIERRSTTPHLAQAYACLKSAADVAC